MGRLRFHAILFLALIVAGIPLVSARTLSAQEAKQFDEILLQRAKAMCQEKAKEMADKGEFLVDQPDGSSKECHYENRYSLKHCIGSGARWCYACLFPFKCQPAPEKNKGKGREIDSCPKLHLVDAAIGEMRAEPDYPLVTDLMKTEAKKHSAIDDTPNVVTPEDGGAGEEASNSESGGERWHAQHVTLAEGTPGTEVDIKIKKGFQQATLDFQMKHRFLIDEKFFLSAATVAGATKKLVEDYKKKQKALGSALREMREGMERKTAERGSDLAKELATSVLSLTEYEEIASTRAEILEVLACRLEWMEKVNLARQKRMESLTSSVPTTFGQGSGTPLPADSGTVTGFSPETTLESSESIHLGNKALHSASEQQGEAEILSSFGSFTTKGSARGDGSVDASGIEQADSASLFERIHVSAREQEKRGVFQRGIVD